MANRGVVAVGTSAGGIEALLFLAKGLSRDFSASVLVTIHLPSHRPSSLNRTNPDHVVPLADMPALLHRLTHQPEAEPVAAPRSTKFEVAIARDGCSNMDEMDHLGRRSVLACPDCGGVLWEIDEGELVRYRCHVGHTYTAELMSVALDDSLRRALASALRALEERVALARKLHRQAVDSGHRMLAESWSQKTRECEREMDVIRESMRRADQLAAHAVRAVAKAAVE